MSNRLSVVRREGPKSVERVESVPTIRVAFDFALASVPSCVPRSLADAEKAIVEVKGNSRRGLEITTRVYGKHQADVIARRMAWMVPVERWTPSHAVRAVWALIREAA